jgi:hypothetical protein
MNKYRNVITTVKGKKFHSKKEANYYLVLRDELKRGKIDAIVLQRKFELIPKQEGELPVHYIADFVTWKNGHVLDVIDVKGVRTAAYIIKRKLMLWIL